MQLIFLIAFEVLQYSIFETVRNHEHVCSWWSDLISEAKEEYKNGKTI